MYIVCWCCAFEPAEFDTFAEAVTFAEDLGRSSILWYTPVDGWIMMKCSFVKQKVRDLI